LCCRVSKILLIHSRALERRVLSSIIQTMSPVRDQYVIFANQSINECTEVMAWSVLKSDGPVGTERDLSLIAKSRESSQIVVSILGEQDLSLTG
jgi:hypothetical protein